MFRSCSRLGWRRTRRCVDMHLTFLSFSFLFMCVGFFVKSSPMNALEKVSDDIAGPFREVQQELLPRDSVSHRTIYVLGDLHGDFEATLSLLEASHLVQWARILGSVENVGKHLRIHSQFENVLRWTGNDAVLVQLGDIVDRGPDGYLINKMFMYLFEKAREQNGIILHILGNHELLNLQGEMSFVNPVEFYRYYDNNFKRWRKEWSMEGTLGNWIRERFSVYTTLNNRFLFVHAGLKPVFSQIPDAQLKKCLWKQLDREKPQQPRHKGSQNKEPLKGPHEAASSNFCPWDDTLHLDDFMSSFLGRQGPFWLRSFSVMPQEEMCPEIDKTLRSVFPFVPHPNPQLKSRSDLEQRLADPKFMLVGHTITKSGDIEVRCNCQSPEGRDDFGGHPSFYILVDTGISRFVRGSGKILKITETDETVVLEQISSNKQKTTLLTVPLDDPCGKAKDFSMIHPHHV